MSTPLLRYRRTHDDPRSFSLLSGPSGLVRYCVLSCQSRDPTPRKTTEIFEPLRLQLLQITVCDSESHIGPIL